MTFTPGAAGTVSASLTIATNSTSDTAVVNLFGNGELVDLSFNNAIVPIGQSATLSWSAPNAMACTASGAWSGSEPTTGTQIVTPVAAGYYSYTLTCGTASNSVVLTAYGATPVIQEPVNEVGHQEDFYVGPPNQIVGLQTTFIVPPLPPVPSVPNAAVFLWPGITPAPNSADFMPINNGVLQPVLSWGDSCAPTPQPAPFSSWWISAQYVNTFGNDPGYTGCFSGSAMPVNPGDLLLVNMFQDASTGVWTQVVTDANKNQSVLFYENLLGQGQNWAYFAIEEWYDATISTPLTFANTAITFQAPDTSGWCSILSSQAGVNAYGITPLTPQNKGLQCYIASIVTTSQ